MVKTRVLTGITTTGSPHLGNYVGAIRPAVAASHRDDVESFSFLADYHALIKCDDPVRIQRSRLEIAATWLACGLDPDRVVFYRQSDIPEIPELTWLLTCVAAKGLMNRAHAYKAAVDANLAANEDADAGITMGLYSYPILMAADILMFNANRVPVGRDQIQHIEMARDIGARFNHLVGAGREYFVLPEAAIEEAVATLPGLDGRKMSKSYDNTIPLFEGGPKRLREAILRIVTDSKLPGEPKDPDGSALFTIFQAFADPDETAAFRAELVAGLAWGEAKQRLFERLERELAPMRERYDALIAKPADIEDVLLAGATKARTIAGPFIDELREAVGLVDFRRPLIAKPLARKLFQEACEQIAGKDEIVPLDIRGPSADDFSLTIKYSKNGRFISKTFANKNEAIDLRKAIDAGTLIDVGVIPRDDGLSEICLLRDGLVVARGPGVSPFNAGSEREKVLESLAARRESKSKK